MKHPPFCTASGAYRFAYQDPPLLRRGYYFFGYGHKPAELIRLPDHTFTVTILRDPVDRVVSLYRYLADPQADEGQTFHALDGERDWARSSFGHFLDRVPRLLDWTERHLLTAVRRHPLWAAAIAAAAFGAAVGGRQAIGKGTSRWPRS